jgi:hypothetical protein
MNFIGVGVASLLPRCPRERSCIPHHLRMKPAMAGLVGPGVRAAFYLSLVLMT